jgi:hypothetical protein
VASFFQQTWHPRRVRFVIRSGFLREPPRTLNYLAVAVVFAAGLVVDIVAGAAPAAGTFLMATRISFTGVLGLSLPSWGTREILSTTSWPETTSPKMVCLPFRCLGLEPLTVTREFRGEFRGI